MPSSRPFPFARLKWAVFLLACLALALWLGGCAGAGYYWQSAVGHMG